MDADAEINADDEFVDIPVAAELYEDAPTMKSLNKMMDEAYNDLALITDLAEKDEKWATFFAALGTRSYGKIVTQVNLEFDQVDVAEFLAKRIPNFTCAHVAAAIPRSKTMAYRGQIVRKVAPMCKDLKENVSLIVDQLDEWEKIVCEEALE